MIKAVKRTSHYQWLYDSLNSLKAFKYFRLIPNTNYQGVLLISKTKRKKIFISILRTSKRCYRVSYNYIFPSCPMVAQKFLSFKTCSLLCDWFGGEVLPQFKSYKPPKACKNIIKKECKHYGKSN